MKYKHLLVDENHQGMITITLNNPEQLNAYTRVMLIEFGKVLDKISRMPDIKAVVITGSGRGFCAGQSLQEELPPEKAVEYGLGIHYKVIHGLINCRVPVIAAVNGIAAGAGVSIALACDFIVMSRQASFSMAFSRLGLVPDLGATYLLPTRIGRNRALYAMLSNETIDADTALAWGLAVKLTEPDELYPEVEKLAKRIAVMPGEVATLTKKMVDKSGKQPFRDQFQEELQINAELVQCDFFEKAIQQFSHKMNNS